MRISDLYEQDIHAWTQQTAELLRQHRFQELDIEHLVEELETMSRRDRQQLVSRLKILLGHLAPELPEDAYILQNVRVTLKGLLIKVPAREPTHWLADHSASVP